MKLMALVKKRNATVFTFVLMPTILWTENSKEKSK